MTTPTLNGKLTTSTLVDCPICKSFTNADPQTGRCLKCGHLPGQPRAEPVADRNAGVPSRSPSQAYRVPPAEIGEAARASEYARRRETATSPIDAPFDASVSVAAQSDRPLIRKVASEDRPAPKERATEVAQAEAREPTQPTQPSQPSQPKAADSPSQAWIAETRAIADAFLLRAAAADQSAADIAAQIASYKAEASRLRRSAAIYTTLLDQIAASEVPAEDPAPAAAPTGPWVRWSHNSNVQTDVCIDCGQSDRPHAAHGRCRPCDSRWRTQQKAGSR